MNPFNVPKKMHFWQVQEVQPAKIFVRFSDGLLVFPIAVCDVIHADAHELVQCRFLFHSISPSVVSDITSEPGNWQAEKGKKAGISLVASDIF